VLETDGDHAGRLQQQLERLALELQHDGLAGRLDRGGSGRAVDQRHLPHKRALVESGQDAVAAGHVTHDVHGASRDDVAGRAGVPFSTEHGAVGVFPRGRGRQKRLQLLVAEPLEALERAQVDASRVRVFVHGGVARVARQPRGLVALAGGAQAARVHLPLQPLIGVPDAARQVGDHPADDSHGHLGGVLFNGQQHAPLDLQDQRRLGRHHVRGARCGIDARHLAHDLTGVDSRDLGGAGAVLDADREAAFGDDDHAVALLPLFEELRPGGQLTRPHRLGQRVRVLITEGGEERHPAKVLTCL